MRCQSSLRHQLHVHHPAYSRPTRRSRNPIRSTSPILARGYRSSLYLSLTYCRWTGHLRSPLLSCWRVSKSPHSTVLRSNLGVHRCSQHTQAEQDNDHTEEELERELAGTPGDNSQGAGPDDETGFFKAEHARADIVSLLTEPVLRPSERLLQVIGKYLPRAIPTVHMYQAVRQRTDDDVENGRDVFHLEATNGKYGILVRQVTTISEPHQASLDTVFEALAREYSEQLAAKIDASDTLYQDIRSFPMHKLRHILGLEQITTIATLTGLPNSWMEDLGLFSIQAYSGKECLGNPQLWCRSSTAQRLARMSADAAMLHRAEEAGIDLHIRRKPPPMKKEVENPYQLPKVTPRETPRIYNASISQDCLSAMLYTLQKLRTDGLPDEVRLQPLQRILVPSSSERQSTRRLEVLNRRLKLKERAKAIDPGLSTMHQERDKLPIRELQTANHIVETVDRNDVIILVSETGSGKTTQLPQILLERAIWAGKGATCEIVCTQPRRIAATSVAARVAHERGTHIGGHIGYQIRFDSQPPNELGNIQYVTAGVLLNWLQDGRVEILDHVSHIIIDEIHERSLTIDILMAFLRDLMRRRKTSNTPFPKLILMSATMKVSDFEQYFSENIDGFSPRVASITIAGRAFPVTPYMLDDIIPTFTESYTEEPWMMELLRESKESIEIEDELALELEKSRVGQYPITADDGKDGMTNPNVYVQRDPKRDAIMPYSLITATLAHILRTYETGDILIFLPGMKEIDWLSKCLESRLTKIRGWGDPDKIRLFKLHAAFQGTNAQVFEAVPDGCRRIIIATNIAQTSITLPGVVHVIDSGKRREMMYDQVSRRNSFDAIWIDRATSFQRRGRAGRVQSGYYWAMFTKTRFDTMPERAGSEMLISDLTSSSLILKSHSDQIDLRDFFAHTLDKPDPKVVAACVQELQRLGMLTHDEKITPLGQFCSEFPLRPAEARGLLLGLLFSCFQPMLLIASHDSTSPLVDSTVERKSVWITCMTFAGVTDDDRYAFITAFLQYDRACREGLQDEMASLENKHVSRSVYHNMLNVAHQIYELMAQYDFFRDKSVLSLQTKTNVFKLLGPSTDLHGHRVDLFKALAHSVVDTNLAVWDDEEASWLAKDIKVILRPNSVNNKSSFKMMKRGDLRKDGELVGYSEMLRNATTSSRPYLLETSSITPLMAMLFGAPIAIIDDNTVELDGWLRYKVRLAPCTNKIGEAGEPVESVAMVIFEFRKALDRFFTLAFSNLRKSPTRSKRVQRRTRRNPLFWPGPLRDTVVEGIIAILAADAEHNDHILEKT